jgi:hypothetical protein
VRFNKKSPLKSDKKTPPKAHKKGVVGYNKKTALLEEAITHMNEGKYGRSSATLKELLALDPLNTEARRLFATLHLRLGSLISARTAFESLAREALERQDFWLAESLLREYLTAGPRCVPFLEMLGRVYEQKGDSIAAVAEYGKAIDVLIEDPDPEQPDRAANLFAKIRSLGAGGPEVFRLAALFDSATGQLLSPPSVSSTASVEDRQPATEPVSTAGEAGPTLLEQPEAPLQTTQPESPTEPQASASFPDPLEQHNAAATPGSALQEATDNQETTVPASLADKEQVNSAEQEDEVPASAQPISQALDEVLDSPLKLLDEATVLPVAPTTSDRDQTPPPNIATTECSFKTEPVSQSISDAIAVPDLSLHEVTQSIADPPSTPVSMPWDQVQDTTLSIPLPSADLEIAQVLDAESAHSTEGLSIPESAEEMEEQPSLPVQPDSLLSSMSWEDILAAVGKGPEVPSAPEPAGSTGSRKEEDIDPVPVVSDLMSVDPEEPAPASISEPVADEQTLPVPMPWEQVEEESVSIPQHEPEPEFGAVPEDLSPAAIDDAAPPHSENEQGEATDPTLAIDESLTASPADFTASPAEREQTVLTSSPLTCQEPAQEQPVDSFDEPPISQSNDPPPVREEASAVPVIPSEQHPAEPIEPAAVPLIEETPLPDIADDATTVADPSTVVQTARPLALHVEPEPVPFGPDAVASEPATEAQECSDASVAPLYGADPYDQPIHPEPVVNMPAPSEPALALEESSSLTPPRETNPPPAAHETAEPRDINILWDEPSPSSPPEQTKPGLLSRWLCRPKHDEPADPTESVAPEPSDEPVSDRAPVPSTPSVSFTPEATIPVIARGEVVRDQSADSLPIGIVATPSKLKVRKPFVASVSSRLTSGAVRLIDTCFSTTRSIIVSLLALISAIFTTGLIAVGLAALAWIWMEERPNTAFQNLTVTPQRTLQESGPNGYLVLLGFDRGANQDAAPAGSVRKFDKSDLAMMDACLTRPEEQRSARTDAEKTLAGWYHDPDPAARFHTQPASLRAWVNQADRSMARYKQWLTMPFEDWSYGEPMSPHCSMVLHAHRLYVADGFGQDIEAGIDRLVIDLGMWRNILGLAKSLPIKMLAVNAVNDDTAVVSGLLARSDLDDRLLGRLAKAFRPLDQAEQSLRWPMQSELKAAPKIREILLKADAGEPLPIYVSLASMMPLPTQKRLNSYAAYYEAAAKAAIEGRFAGLPKRADFIRYPADSWLDYGLNPIENILGVPPLPEWDTYGGRILELDARLRLASLQAWVRRSPQEDIPTRMAKAGQALYDPFSGFPMLINRRKGVFYSVGQDGKDHDGRPELDIMALIPAMAGELSQDSKRTGTTAKPRS